MILPSRYQFTGTSGGGGMGDIHECTDRHLNRCVILKMLKAGEESRRLLDEQRALLRLRSKHVVQLYDVITVEQGSTKRTALVLEHIDGNDLKVGAFARDAHYLKTLWQVACGLADIHAEKIIHRDIKPNNIRVDADGVVKVLDFGLARQTGLEAQTMSVIGTPGYMAPELWETNTVSFDQSIDVYAFGVTALALVNIDAPTQLLERPPKALPNGVLDGFLGGLPKDVIELISACISFSPRGRPTMRDVEMTLRRHLLKNRHRALLTMRDKTHEINATLPGATANAGSLGSVGVAYDGFRFTVSSLTGAVLINNMAHTVGDELPGCCVIALGANNPRRFVTFDTSNPEVMP